MAKKRFRFSPASALIDLGARIQFAPPSAFASSRAEAEKPRGRFASRLLPYKKKVKNALSKMAEQSAILELFRRFVKFVFTLRLRSLGVSFFLCGFLQIASYFFVPFVSSLEGNTVNLLFGVAQIFLALLCSFSRGDVADALKGSFFFRGILHPLCGVQEWQIPGGKSRDRVAAMFVAGVVVGALSLFISPVKIAKGILLFACVLFIFFSPEAGLAFSVIGAMLLPSRYLIALLLLTLVSFLFKCSVGKRSLIVSPMDPLVLLFLLPFLSASLKGDGVGFFSLIFLYWLALCLVRTLAGFGRLLSAMTAASLMLAVLLSARLSIELFFPSLFLRVEGLDSFFFIQPDGQTGLLIAMATPLLLGLMQSTRSGGKRFLRFVSFLVHILSLALLRNSAVWLAAILGIMIYLLFSFRSGLLLLCMAGLGAISVFRILPHSMALSLLRFFGVQVDQLSASSAGGSLLRYFHANGGLLWSLVFLLLFCFFVYEALYFGIKTTHPRMHPRVFGVVCAVAVFFAGAVQDMNLNYRSLALFLVLLSLPRAVFRAARREEVRLPY